SFLQLIRDPELAPGFQWSAALQLATAIACVFWYFSPAQGMRAVITHVGIGVALLLSTGFALYVGMQALRAQALGVSIMQAAGVAEQLSRLFSRQCGQHDLGDRAAPVDCRHSRRPSVGDGPLGH